MVAVTQKDCVYLFILDVQLKDPAEADFTVQATISMQGPQGFLSAIDWPLLPVSERGLERCFIFF